MAIQPLTAPADSVSVVLAPDDKHLNHLDEQLKSSLLCILKHAKIHASSAWDWRDDTKHFSAEPKYRVVSQGPATRVSLVAQWLNGCIAAKTVLMIWGSIPGSRLKVDSAFYPSKVGKMSTQLAGAGGGGMCSLHN